MNTPDIDIERLREAMEHWDGAITDHIAEPERASFLAMVATARFLVSLTDEGGELWIKKPCADCEQHGTPSYGCPSGSRVWVWPPTEGRPKLTEHDIDIDWLREGLDRWGPNIEPQESLVWHLLEAARFLVSLADEGGELWVEKRCKHGLWLAGFHEYDTPCYGGSRVRVWPKGAQ